jgi:hypothetical protein
VATLAAAVDLEFPGCPGPVPVPPSWLHDEVSVLELRSDDSPRHLVREDAAILLDRLLVRVARGRGAIDVAIGECLAALSSGDPVLRLGYSGLGDYARERLDVQPRTAQAMARLARELRSRPMLRDAVHRGEVSTRKAQAILPLAVGGAEAEWVARARIETVRALEKAARERAPRDGDDETWERIDLALAPEQRAVVDEALALAGKVLGGNPPRFRRIEALCEEYLGAHPVEPTADERVELACEPSLAEMKEGLEAEMGRWAWLDELHAIRSGERGPGGRVAAPVPGSAEEPADVLQLDADVRRLAEMRRSWDALLGRLAMLVRWSGVWRDMRFASFGHYCEERLGLAERTVAQRAALERRLYAVPALRAALESGRLSYEKARLVSDVADAASLDGWIALAERSTCIALRREVEAREEAQTCARGSLSVRIPGSVAILLRAALAAAIEAEGRWMPAGECLVRMAQHFIDTWKDAVPRRKTVAQRVLERDLGWCQVPGCSRPADDSHHITFRSAGGSDDHANQTGTCKPHHLHGIHRGYVRVRGRAPDQLTWELGRGYDGEPLEVFGPTR